MSNKNKTVFVTVGTTQFDQLVLKVATEEICQKLNDLGFKRMIIQAGHSKPPSKKAVAGVEISTFDFKDSILEYLQKAHLVISHAGAGTTMETLNEGKPLITVVNEKLMNNHQIELAEQMSKDGYSLFCTCSSLRETLNRFDKMVFEKYIPGDPTKFGIFMDKVVGFS
ncbi:UDP-N-acetylglucosamine transferase subunit ALG13 homolog isoform X1 [Octopus vulgaris]|uniref:UDP-N-acetylglucosamine transferase subunit ALG13 n=1 Tax=Octopus vulgaris TaxID=6645 RepID=A0AA36BFG9_OCTVU|nr:UDP-N-acetylglucosamine transferase subunit ALG13 homolog isoform X1 [Octopus vulgaris]